MLDGSSILLVSQQYNNMNLIQKLESDISQATEYGGIPNHYSRSELRQILAALKIGQSLSDNLEEAAQELKSFGTSIKDLKYDAAIKEWRVAINL